MRRIRKITWAFVVLTTATSVLLANVPVMACACPQTTPKDADDNSSCCCGNHCCTASESEPPCCQPTTPVKPDDGDSIQAPDCPKDAVPRTDLQVDIRETIGDTIAFQLALSAIDAPHLADLQTVASEMHWHVYQPPPTPDLVIVLQHFVI